MRNKGFKDGSRFSVKLKNWWIWCRRMGHCKGFGVQSPFAYSFVTRVLLGKTDKTLLPQLKEAAPRGSFRLWSLYYRVATNSSSAFALCVEPVDSGVSLCFSLAGIPCVRCGSKSEVEEVLSRHSEIGMVYIDASVGSAKEIIGMCLSRCGTHSVWLFSRPYATAKAKELWASLCKAPQVSTTFDLYHAGVALFDSHYPRQRFVVNFRG